MLLCFIFRYAQRLDQITGKDQWKTSTDVGFNIPGYDHMLIEFKKEKLRQYKEKKDIRSLIQCLRNCLDPSLIGTLNKEFYSMTFSGTKQINEEFQKSIIDSIKFLDENFSLIDNNVDLCNAIQQWASIWSIYNQIIVMLLITYYKSIYIRFHLYIYRYMCACVSLCVFVYIRLIDIENIFLPRKFIFIFRLPLQFGKTALFLSGGAMLGLLQLCT